jgi:hypothetical protein
MRCATCGVEVVSVSTDQRGQRDLWETAEGPMVFCGPGVEVLRVNCSPLGHRITHWKIGQEKHNVSAV